MQTIILIEKESIAYLPGVPKYGADDFAIITL